MDMTRVRWGFKSKNQMPLFMVWREYWCDGEVVNARVIFNSIRWIGI